MRTMSIFTSALLGIAVVAPPAVAAQSSQPTRAEARALSDRKPPRPAEYRQEGARRDKDRRHEAREADERRADGANLAEDRDDD